MQATSDPEAQFWRDYYGPKQPAAPAPRPAPLDVAKLRVLPGTREDAIRYAVAENDAGWASAVVEANKAAADARAKAARAETALDAAQAEARRLAARYPWVAVAFGVATGGVAAIITAVWGPF